jgi:hypothetical protein
MPRRTGRSAADEIWNVQGRPASDATYSMLFPGGIRAYVDAPVDESPYMLELLAELLGVTIHPKLTAEKRAQWQASILEAVPPLRAAVEARAPAAARVALLGRVHASLARVGQMQLAALKRDYKNMGMTETQIHQIIPDATRARRKPATEMPAPGTTPTPS